ncbi:MAG: DUF4159 domain-containing protein [Planctomycetota bacterium]|nr:MAG: DUF4159 domain-containing protein [Planctomycetota bacterium]
MVVLWPLAAVLACSLGCMPWAGVAWVDAMVRGADGWWYWGDSGRIASALTLASGMVVVHLAALYWVFNGLLRCNPSTHRGVHRALLASWLLIIGWLWAAWWMSSDHLWHQLPVEIDEETGAWHLSRDFNIDHFLLRARWILIPALGAAFVLFVGHLRWWSGAVCSVYGYNDEGVAPGDQVIDDIRSGGRDPQYRTSWMSSALLHFLIIFGPLFLGLRGCLVYKLPPGEGQPTTPPVMVIQVEEIEVERLVLNPESPISFHVPDPTDSEMLEQVEQMTEQQVEATGDGVPGPLGTGDGQDGGFGGPPDGELVWLYLRYQGTDWDDGIDDSRLSQNAIHNFLRRFRDTPSINFPVDTRPRAISVAELAHFQDGYAPPFVFMTGHGGINISGSDIQILRDYVQGGGMLFVDAASPAFDRSFRRFIAQVFPNNRLVTIPHDDEIFRRPYRFPHGVHPMAAHGGNNAMGVRIGNRWGVFYHPGDVKDAFKDNAHRMSREMRENAFQVKYNVIFYSILKYTEATARHRRQ